MSWRPEIVARLETLVAKKLTIGQIAIAMHMNRNEIAGKMYRLGLKSLSGQDHGLRNGAQYKTERQQAPVTAPPLLEVIESLASPPSDRKDRYGNQGCQWPLGDPKTDEFRFCLDTRVHSKPYCPDHCRAAYHAKPAGGHFMIFSKRRNINLVPVE
jgi:GcrA cell cycle regulator